MINTWLKDNMESFFNFWVNSLNRSSFICYKNFWEIYFLCIVVILCGSFLTKFNTRNHKFIFITISYYVRFFNYSRSRIYGDKRKSTLVSTMVSRSTLSTYKYHVPYSSLVFVEITITIKKLLLATRAYCTSDSNISHVTTTCICGSVLTFIYSK